ncbi:hypothetical protein COU80_00365 [Candidatus Peregrinibacteria bacterium CG10_big_fil_rev_8_21_14_0_10_55_24]|nr:MAG: hypothetical protein COU80_00365 [Candidatus Peregrinibacteria bacterium CG10_big_fil_rev_8_21_14_0_10_55_24]
MVEEDQLSAYGGCIMPILGDEPSCPYECAYCFAQETGFEQGKTAEEQERIDGRIRATLDAAGGAIRTIFSSRLHEIFARGVHRGLAHIRALARYGKNVSVLTKAALPPEAISELAAIDQELSAQGNHVVVEVSFTSGVERPDLEPCAPKTRDRIVSVEGMAQQGIPVGICISPVLPESIVPTQEIESLIERTMGAIRAYTVARRFVFTEAIAQRLGIDPASPAIAPHTTHRRSLALAEQEKDTDWHVYADPRVRSIMQYIVHSGRRAFAQSRRTVEYLTKSASVSPRTGAG